MIEILKARVAEHAGDEYSRYNFVREYLQLMIFKPIGQDASLLFNL